MECPTGSGRMLNLQEVAARARAAAGAIFLPDATGRRPVPRRRSALRRAIPHWKDLVLFHEYFHGDTGRGVGRQPPDRMDRRWCSAASKIWRAPDAARLAPPSQTQPPARWSRAPMSTPLAIDDVTEWLEADGLGGFASGTMAGIRTRRYHALLLAATDAADRADGAGERDGRVGRDGQAARERGVSDPQRYSPGRRSLPSGARTIESFTARSLAHLDLPAADGTRIEQEMFVPHGDRRSWRPLAAASGAAGPLTLARAAVPLRPRLPRAASREPGVPLRCPTAAGDGSRWRAVRRRAARSSRSPTATIATSREWYRELPLHRGAGARAGLRARISRRPACSTLASSARGEAVLVFGVAGDALPTRADAVATLRPAAPVAERRGAARLRDAARARGRRVHRAARRGQDHRRRLSLVHRLGPRHVHRHARPLPRDRAAAPRRDRSCSSGPARCPRGCCRTGSPTGRRARVQLGGRLALVHRRGARLSARRSRRPDVHRRAASGRRWARGAAIIAGYARGTRYGIRLDTDGLLAAGEPGVQLTWMDAKVGDWVVTPRIGKPVEIQALWLNALRIAAAFTA